MLTDALVRGDDAAAALVSGEGGVTTYGALRSAVDAVAHSLGDVRRRPVAVACADPGAFLVGALAAWRAGAVVVPIDPRTAASSAGLSGPVERVGLAAVMRDDGVERRTDGRVLDARAALLLFTSGSSAEPKAVLLSAHGVVENVQSILRYLPVHGGARTAVVLPLSYSYALVGQALTTLAAGGAVLLLGALGYPALQVDAMRAFGANGLSSVPASLRLLARAAVELPQNDRPRLDYVASAGAALDDGTVARAREAFRPAHVFNQYGLTEASPRVAAVRDDDPAFARGSVGRPIHGVDVWTIATNGQPLPAGEEGEIVVRGPSVMLGYLDDDAGTARVLDASGALRTGDAGRIDAEGNLFVSGRADGVVKCAGERVSVEEVAAVLRSAEGVRDACVIAVAHPELGATLHAYVEAPSDAIGRLRGVLREKLSPAKRPSKIVAMDALPRTANGKVARHALGGRS